MYFKKGKVIIISAPSGSGKTTIARYLLKQKFNLKFSVSACTRKKRKNEVDGVDYFFFKVDDFKRKIKENNFLEWEEVYPNSFYGTLKKDVEYNLKLGYNVLFDIDVKGAMSLKKYFDKDSCSIYIDAPLNVIEQRLSDRNTETNRDLSLRLKKIKQESLSKINFDVIIENIDLQEAKEKAKKCVENFLKK